MSVFWRAIKSKVQDYVATLLARKVLERDGRRQVKARRKVAPQRAEQLLLEHLTIEQRHTYWRYGWFIVRGQSGTRYSIWTKDPLYSNVCELDESGQIVSQLCAHAAVNLPRCDQLLTQKLMLEHHEAEFRRIANQGIFVRQTYERTFPARTRR